MVPAGRVIGGCLMGLVGSYTRLGARLVVLGIWSLYRWVDCMRRSLEWLLADTLGLVLFGEIVSNGLSVGEMTFGSSCHGFHSLDTSTSVEAEKSSQIACNCL